MDKSKNTILYSVYILVIVVFSSSALNLNSALLLRIQTRANGSTSVVQGTQLSVIISSFTTDSMRVSFRNAPYAFAFYDSLNAPISGNFSLADSALFVVDFRTNISGFYRILPGLWDALNAVIMDSSYATMRTVFVPDTTGQQKASVIAFHYKGFIEADMENFTERPGFGKYRLYFPIGVNETTLSNELQAAGVQFAQ